MVNNEKRRGVYAASMDKTRSSFLVFDSPHSGRCYPSDFNFSCDPKSLRRSEDILVDRLFEPVVAGQYSFLKALFPRSYIDVNRDSQKIDGKLLPRTGASDLKRVDEAHGTGLIRRFCSYTMPQPIYDRKLTLSEVFNRLNGYYHPYHKKLTQMLHITHQKMGGYVYLSCHSLPSKFRDGGDNPYDIYLGTQDGQSCDPNILSALKEQFERKGYKVAINKFFKGGHNIKTYGDPSANQHAILVEINRKLYVDENTLRPNKNFEKLQSDLKDIIKHFDAETRRYLLSSKSVKLKSHRGPKR